VSPSEDGEQAVEQFADGEIRSYRGGVDGWLLAVYAVLAVWGVYYLFAFWGGLGPGQGR
jgi:hypothetical protein